MSNPILAPHHENVVRSNQGTPLGLLAGGFPRGAIAPVVWLLVLGAVLAVTPVLFGYAGHARR